VGRPHLRGSRTARPVASLARGPLQGLGSAPSGADGHHAASTGGSSRAAGGGERSRPSPHLDVRDAGRWRCCPGRSVPCSRVSRSSPGTVARPHPLRFPSAAGRPRGRCPAPGPARSTRAAAGGREPRPPSLQPDAGEAGSSAWCCHRSRPCPRAPRSPLAASREGGPARGTEWSFRFACRCGGSGRRSTDPALGSCSGFPAFDPGQICGFHVSAQTDRTRVVSRDSAASGRHRPPGDGMAEWGLTP
jgi:hypothetical protein